MSYCHYEYVLGKKRIITMAFITPLMRKDFNIYSRRKTDRDYRTAPITIVRKAEESTENYAILSKTRFE
uniref:Phage protein n=1 Tax=Heterorhabditis bacteriophora TaxID=37862 RepID=A0A1I7WL99_HETBA